MNYVLAFIYDQSGNILLIRKNRPEALAGKLNGIGGKVEENELPIAAILREVKEETDLDIDSNLLNYLGSFANSIWSVPGKVYCYSMTIENFDSVKQLTDETLRILPYKNLESSKIDCHALAYIHMSAISEIHKKQISYVTIPTL